MAPDYHENIEMITFPNSRKGVKKKDLAVNTKQKNITKPPT